MRFGVFRRFFSTVPPVQKKQSILGPLIFSSICLTAAGLGVWQTKRYFWKVNLLEEAKLRVDDAHISEGTLTQLLGQKSDHDDAESKLLGRRIVLTGKFDHSKEVLYGPRSAPAGLLAVSAQGLSTNPMGFFVVTPFITSSGEVYLVNRGWIPRTAKDFNRPQETTTIQTVLGKFERQSTFTPVNPASTKQLLWLEKEAALKVMGYPIDQSFLVVDLLENEGTVHSSTEVRIPPYPKKFSMLAQHHVHPSTHLAYAFTWYTLAIAGTVMTYKKFNPKQRSQAVMNASKRVK